MKTKKPSLIFFLAGFLTLLSWSCSSNCDSTFTNIYYEPVLTDKTEIRAGVSVEGPKLIESRGKIFFKGGYLFINEPKNGIHVIDNRFPENPQNIAFIKVPGSFDIAVKDNLLFTDSYMDLVTFDISDLTNIREVNRLEDYFQAYEDYYYAYTGDESRVVTDWVEERREENLTECDNVFWGNDVVFLETAAVVQISADAGGSSLAKAPGIAGSLARFAVTENHLYVLDAGALKNLELTSPLNPVEGEELYVAWDVETLFPRGDEMFVGASSGMHILDISNRSTPELLSQYRHVNSCDPVIVEGDIAFVTLRSGTECDGFTDQLEVIDISNLRAPQLLHSFPMFNPHGLSKDGDALFICDGTDGLKVFDASDLATIGSRLIAHDPNIQAYDVITYRDVAMLIGDDGLRQYDYSDLNDIKLLSTIQISFDD